MKKLFFLIIIIGIIYIYSCMHPEMTVSTWIIEDHCDYTGHREEGWGIIYQEDLNVYYLKNLETPDLFYDDEGETIMLKDSCALKYMAKRYSPLDNYLSY